MPFRGGYHDRSGGLRYVLVREASPSRRRSGRLSTRYRAGSRPVACNHLGVFIEIRPMAKLPSRWPGRVGLLVIALGFFLVATIALRGLKGGRWSTRMGSDRRSGHWDAVARGEAYLRQGRPDLAIQAVSHVRDEGRGAGEAMTVAGQGFLAFQDLQAARLALERALKLQPNQPRVAKLLATICLSTGDAARGLQYLAIAAHHEPTDIVTWEAARLSRVVQNSRKQLNEQDA